MQFIYVHSQNADERRLNNALAHSHIVSVVRARAKTVQAGEHLRGGPRERGPYTHRDRTSEGRLAQGKQGAQPHPANLNPPTEGRVGVASDWSESTYSADRDLADTAVIHRKDRHAIASGLKVSASSCDKEPVVMRPSLNRTLSPVLGAIAGTILDLADTRLLYVTLDTRKFGTATAG
jgi:hypothetical protein